ncbi:MAG: hypothetical protein ACFFD4_36360 [Candidatus Odinarchaeota archaeon]
MSLIRSISRLNVSSTNKIYKETTTSKRPTTDAITAAMIDNVDDLAADLLVDLTARPITLSDTRISPDFQLAASPI